MAKYNVSHTCGHSETVQLFGKHVERERKLEWLAGQDCPECRAAAFNAANAAKAAEIRASDAVAHLPALKGTEKQIAWAEVVRARLLGELENRMVEAEARGEADRRTPEQEAELALGHDYLTSQAEARWWIDHRDEGLATLLKSALQATAEREAAAAERAHKASIAEKVEALSDRWHTIWARPREKDGYAYSVKKWTRDDTRVYINVIGSASRDGSMVEYYHDGNRYNKPGKLVVEPKSLARAAERRGVPPEQVEAEVLAFVRDVAGWKCLTIHDTREGW